MTKRDPSSAAHRGIGPRSSEALEAWLEGVVEVLADQRAHSVSPSFVDAIASDSAFETALAMRDLAAGLLEILRRLIGDPGRWILILESGQGGHQDYLQLILHEDGSVVMEAVADEHLRLAKAERRHLEALGWEGPQDAGRPHWMIVEAILAPDVTEVARLCLETLRTVFHVEANDQIDVRMFSSPKRGATPASSQVCGRATQPEPETLVQPATEQDSWQQLRSARWAELEGLPSQISFNRWAARASCAWLTAQGLAAEIKRLRRLDSTPAPGRKILLRRAESASLEAHEAAQLILTCSDDDDFDEWDRDEAAVRCADRTLDAERAARQLAQLAMGVSSCHDGDPRNLRLDRAAVAVVCHPLTGASLRADGIEMFATTQEALLSEMAGLICRLIVEPNTTLLVGPVELEADHDGNLTLTDGSEVHHWETPVSVYFPAAKVIETLTGSPIPPAIRLGAPSRMAAGREA